MFSKFFEKFFLYIVLFYSFIPFLCIILASFDETPQLWITTVDFTFKNFIKLIFSKEALLWFLNSTIYALGTLFLVLIASALGGYTLSRINVWWKAPFLYFILLIRIIPGTTYLVPRFKMINSMGLLDTYFSVILIDAAEALPIGIWIMKTFYDTINKELEEAVWIDGGNRFTSLTRVVFPLSLPAVAAVSILTFTSSWGTFLTPLLFITSPSKIPLGIAIYRAYVTPQTIDFAFMAALSMLYMIPAIALFIFFRKYLIKSFNIAGVNG